MTNDIPPERYCQACWHLKKGTAAFLVRVLNDDNKFICDCRNSKTAQRIVAEHNCMVWEIKLFGGDRISTTRENVNFWRERAQELSK